MPDDYELLTVENIPGYVARTPYLATRLDPASLTVREVGDGNLNLVFILRDGHAGSAVLKQALPYVRLVGPEWPMTPQRAVAEARAMATHARLAPEAVPELYGFDEDRYVIAMEDLSDHRVWRAALNDGERHERAAADMGRYVAAVAFGTSLFGMAATEVKRQLAAAINPELCEITEDLVFTEPFAGSPRNDFLPALAPVVAEVQDDPEVVAAAGAMKHEFMTRGEALIHGDLHTGSVMVRAGGDGRPPSTKAIDSEFAYYGPVGFDLGALWGNFLLAASRAVALGEDARAAWLLAQIPANWAAFEAEFRRRWPQRVDPRVFTAGFLERWLAQVRAASLGFAACKATRRIVGLAKVSDVETLPPHLRVGAATGVLRVARVFLLERDRLSLEAAIAVAGEILDKSATR